MAHIFISYSRKDKAFVERVHAALTALGRDVWVDWEDIPPTAEWREEIFGAIRAADAFLFVISPDSATSSICREEIQQAALNNKRIVPLTWIGVSSRELPENIARLNWIYIRQQDDFETAIQTLAKSLDTDLAYVQAHTRLQVRAAEWDNKQRSSSFTLHGEDLSGAEALLAEGAKKEPHPTTLQVEYITFSRLVQRRTQRRLLLGVSAALIITLVLAVLAFWQSQVATGREQARATQQSIAVTNEFLANSKEQARATQQAVAESERDRRATQQAIAEQERKLALASNLASQGRLLFNEHLDLALLLGTLSLQIEPNGDALSSLYDALEHRPDLDQFLHSETGTLATFGFSPDGKQLVTAGSGGIIERWDLASGKPVSKVTSNSERQLLALTIGAQGQVWVVELNQKILLTWAVVEDGSSQGQWKALGPPVQISAEIYQDSSPGDGAHMARLSPDGKILAVGGPAEYVTLYEVSSGTQIGETVRLHSFPIDAMAFSPDGKLLATAGNEWQIYLWDTLSGKRIDIWQTDHTRSITALTFSADGRFLASGSLDGTVNLFDRSSGKRIPRQPLTSITTGQEIPPPALGHPAAVTSLAFSPDGALLVSGAEDGNLLAWSTDSMNASTVPLTTYTGPVAILAFNPTGGSYAAGGSDGTVTVWNPGKAWRLARSSFGIGDEIGALANPADSRSTPPEIASLTGGIFDRPARVALRSPDSRFLALADCTDPALPVDQPCPGGKLQLLDGANQKPTGDALTGLAGRPEIAAFSPDSRQLAVISCATNQPYNCQKVHIQVWDVLQSKLENQADLAAMPGFLVFSSDSQYLAYDSGIEIHLWAPASGQLAILALPVPADAKITGLVINPGATRISAAATYDDPGPYANTIQHSLLSLWQLPSTQLIGRIVLPDTTVNSMAFSESGKYVVIDQSKDLSAWQLDVQTWQDLACRLANRNLSQAEWSRYAIGEDYRPVCPGESN